VATRYDGHPFEKKLGAAGGRPVTVDPALRMQPTASPGLPSSMWLSVTPSTQTE
jgi:hypothetical protein